MSTFTPTKNQSAIIDVLAADGELLGAQEIARSKGVSVGTTSVYASLRALKDHGFVVEKVVRRGTTPKGNRVKFRLSAKGSKLFA